MKIAHFSDTHYCQKYLVEVDHCLSWAINEAVKARCECAVLSGDLFDHRVDLHAPTVAAAVTAIKRLADAMPVLILQGTLSHDPAGCLEVFKAIGGKYPIFVADKICRISLTKDEEGQYSWEDKSESPNVFTSTLAYFSCLPSINKGEIAAEMGQAYLPEMLGEHTARLLVSWAATNKELFRDNGIPTIVVSHGTVSGSITEHGCPMVGLDNEYTTGTLFSAGASAVMLGHIHKHQSWRQEVDPTIYSESKGFSQAIAYAGSIGRLHFGEMDPKGFLIWEVEYDSADFKFITTPAKELVDIEFEGAPDMVALGEAAADCAGKHVRLRYVLDEEHRNIVDRDLIENLFKNAAELKIEPRILPIQRSRAEGITHLTLVREKLSTWCEVTETVQAPLQTRLLGLQERGQQGMMKDLNETILSISKSPLEKQSLEQ